MRLCAIKMHMRLVQCSRIALTIIPEDQAHLLLSEGRPNVTDASNLDRSAGSRSWRLLVAPTTMLLLCGPNPSSWRSSTPSSRRVASCISELQKCSHPSLAQLPRRYLCTESVVLLTLVHDLDSTAGTALLDLFPE